MKIISSDSKIRYTGRWNKKEGNVTSTSNGSYFEFMFFGESAVIHFDVSDCVVPYPHIYISVDSGAMIECVLQPYIRISAEQGEHTVKVIMKGSVESQNRWYKPIESKVTVTAIEADLLCEMPEDNRPIIEFIGDSITEGISIDTEYAYYGENKDMVFWDDSTAGYAWRVAEMLDFRPIIMGYGSLGVTRDGSGGVPEVGSAYAMYSDGEEMDSNDADYIVINHGTNDIRAEHSVFTEKYVNVLSVLRNRNKKAKIISITPFSGRCADKIKDSVELYNKNNNDNVLLIDSTGWIEPEPIHPTREGHKIVAEHIVKILKKNILL